MNDAYAQGFLQKCAEEGVDPQALLKAAQNADAQFQMQMQNARYGHQLQPRPVQPIGKPLGRLPSLNQQGADIYNAPSGGRRALARASTPTSERDPRISGPGGVIEQARAQTPWGGQAASPVTARQAGPQVAGNRPPAARQPWQPTSPVEQAMMATHGKPTGQQAAAFRSTLAGAQGLSANQQRIAGQQGGQVTPYGTMSVGRRPAQNVARPAARPAAAAAPASPFARVATPALSPYPSPAPAQRFARVETPTLGYGS